MVGEDTKGHLVLSGVTRDQGLGHIPHGSLG